MGTVWRNGQWCGCVLPSLLLLEAFGMVVMLCSAQLAAGPGDRTVPALSMGGLLPPNIRRVPTFVHVSCLATGCCHTRYSLDIGTGQHFPCCTRASAAHNSICEAVCLSVRSPCSEGRIRSPGVGVTGLQPFPSVQCLEAVEQILFPWFCSSVAPLTPTGARSDLH